MALNHVTLDDKYDLDKTRVFVTGFQAIVRLCLMQKERDRRAGLNTAGYVTGYRGSPLGTLDLQFMRAEARLKANDILFHSGTNEDLAATALAGSQTAELRGEGDVPRTKALANLQGGRRLKAARFETPDCSWRCERGP